jgi:hypothetical protein
LNGVGVSIAMPPARQQQMGDGPPGDADARSI